MTCEQANGLLKAAGSAVFYSGPNKYDLYHVDGSACYALRQDEQPAYVATRDTAQCFIGYTCVEPEDKGPDRDR